MILASVAAHQTLYDLIQARIGVILTETQRENVAQNLETWLAQADLPGLQSLVLALVREPLDHPLWQELIGATTVGETYFFRNEYQFDALRSSILPSLIDERRRAGFRQLRFWSAGCATGEEPYSLAMLLCDLISDIEGWSISILATDINSVSLERARSGVYRAWSFRGETPEDIRDRWFSTTSDGYRLDSKIRSMVAFAPLNLAAEDYPSLQSGTMSLDLILCRNVTIYFDQPTTREIVERFHYSLNDDGWLVVGHAEPSSAVYDDLFMPRNFGNTVLYQKRAAPQPIETLLPGPLVPLTIVPLVTINPGRIERPAPEAPRMETPQPDILQRAKQAADIGNWAEALGWLSQAEHDNPLHPHIHYLRALVHMHNDSPDDALMSLRRAIYCDPSFALAYYTLGELHAKRGEIRQAVRCLRLAQLAIADLEPLQPLAFDDDLTVEMLQELLRYRLNSIPDLRSGNGIR